MLKFSFEKLRFWEKLCKSWKVTKFPQVEFWIRWKQCLKLLKDRKKLQKGYQIKLINKCKNMWRTKDILKTMGMSNICQNWPNSSDGCPPWIAIAWPPEVLLTWILFMLDNCKLFIMFGAWDMGVWKDKQFLAPTRSPRSANVCLSVCPCVRSKLV